MIKKGQKVKILTGDDKNKTGTVLKVLPRQNKVIVEGVNVKKEHVKAKSSNDKGSVVEISAPIHISNVISAN